MNDLRFEEVSHAYGTVDVVREVSMNVVAGEVACLLGPSGCGKTTLLRLAAGLEVLLRGRIIVGDRIVADGTNRHHTPPEERDCGLMFQDYALFPHLTILDNIAFGIVDRPAERKNWIFLALERMGMEGLASAYPHTLSGGQQQRTALLRALAPEPKVLLLDEPFSDLDVTRRAQVREQTLDLLRDTRVTTLMVTHDPEEAMFMADRLLVMNEGRIIQSGSPADIYLHPADAFVAGLFGPLNRVVAKVDRGRIESPLGVYPADGLGNGEIASVLVRPEGLLVSELDKHSDDVPPAGVRASVVAARLLGRASHLRVAIAGIDEPLQVLVPGVFLPEVGTEVAVHVDPEHAFVFADD